MPGADFAGALAFAASTGVATFFAPCAFPLLPGYVGYYVGESEGKTRGLPSAAAAATGALGALGAIAVLAFVVGQPLKETLPIFEPIVGVGLILFGVVTLLERGPELKVKLPERPNSLLGFGAFGAVYAVAAAGCVIPLFFGVLAQALALPPLSGLTVLGVYSLGVALPLVGVTLLASAGVDAWRGLGAYTKQMQRVAGVVMVLAGIGQVYLSVVILDVL